MMNKMSKRVVLSLFSVAGLCASSFSQSTGTFTLKSAIQYSLDNNPTSVIYENNNEITKAQNLEGLSRYLPQINAFWNSDYNAKLQTTVIPAGSFSPVQVRIQMGNPFVNSVGVQLDQKIFDESNIVGLKARKQNLQLANLKQQQNNVDLIYNTSVAYYQVLIVEQQVQLLEENKKQYDDLLSIMKLQLDKGVIRKIDYDRTRVALNNISSQIMLAESNQKMALNQLKMSMGMSLDEDLSIDTAMQIVDQIKMPQDESFTPDKRLDYQILNQNMVLQEFDYKMKKMAALPVLSAYGKYGANAYSKQIQTALGQWYDYSAVGLRLSVPIFNGLRVSAQAKQSKYTLENLKQNIKVTMQSSRLEFENAKTKLYSSYLSYAQNKDNMQLAKDVYDASSLEYQQGQAPLTDFLNSDYSYKQAQSNYINSLLNFLSARLAYEKAKGTLPDYINQL